MALAANQTGATLAGAQPGGFTLGNDVFNGTPGDDVITLDAGDDQAFGGMGNDTFYDRSSGLPLTGNDLMSGGPGNDTFNVKDGNDTVDGGADIDSVYYYDSTVPVTLNLQDGFALSYGIQKLISIENANGSYHDDTLTGSGEANTIFGWYGDDRIDGGGGADQLGGGWGNDTILGGEGDDVLSGMTNANLGPLGGRDDDVLDGGRGNDTLIGGPGSDTLTGGQGADRFVLQGPLEPGFDTITDFEHGVDKIDVRSFDARPDQAGDQAFTFDASPDGTAEEFLDGLSDDWQGIITSGKPGPIINGDTGEIECRHADDGYTYVYLAHRGDGLTEATLRIKGHVELSASDFVL